MVAALAREVAGVVRRLDGARSERLGSLTLYQGTLLGAPVGLAVTGMGGERAAHGLRTLIARVPLRAVLSLGFAGALVDGLEPGRLALPERHVLDGDLPPIAPDAGLRSRLLPAARSAGLRPGAGVCVTAEAMVSGADARLALGSAHGAELVDMEGYWLAREAGAAGLPFASARAVSDALADHHPVLESALQGGGVHIPRLLRGYAARPAEIAKLPGLARNARSAAHALERFAAAALPSLAAEAAP